MSESQALFEQLAARAGQYRGRGLDHEGRIFFADLTLEVGAGGRAVSYRFRAQAHDSSEVLQDEHGLIGIGTDGRLLLMASSLAFRNIFPRPMVRLGAGGSGRPGAGLVFAHGDSSNLEEFRDEIRISLFDDGSLGHDHYWALAGGTLALRSSVVLESVAAMDDDRPVFIRHYTKLEDDDQAHYPGSDELLSVGAPLGRLLGLSRIGIHHETVPTGRRTSFPHAELTEEEFVFVVAGYPEVWIDGAIYRLRPGDAIGFKPGTGVAHTFINNAPEPARLLVVGEHRRLDNKVWYPLNPERRLQVGDERSWVPSRTELGPHDGLPDRLRERRKAEGKQD